MIFDPNWLNETSSKDDFSQGIDNWSTFLYKSGIVGRCAYNSANGALLISNPEESGKKVLKIARVNSEELEIQNQGAVWNFPKGRFRTFVYILEGSPGG